VDDPDDRSLPAISIAHAEGVAVALAALDRDAQVGIDVQRIEERPAELDTAAFTTDELELLDCTHVENSARLEWLTRFWCARQAAAKSTGLRLSEGAASATVHDVDFDTGIVRVLLGLNQDPSLTGQNPCTIIRVFTSRRGEFAWAWTLGEGENK
jgi:hypothetical protein